MTAPPRQAGNLAIGQEVAIQGFEPGTARGLWGDAWRRLLANRLAVLGLVVIGFVVVVAILAPFRSRRLTQRRRS